MYTQLDTFYIDNAPKYHIYGYLRTVVVRFEKGNAKESPNEDKSNVIAVVQHQFKAASALSLEKLQEKHKELMESVSGKINKDVNGDPLLELEDSAWAAKDSLIKRKLKKKKQLMLYRQQAYKVLYLRNSKGYV